MWVGSSGVPFWIAARRIGIRAMVVNYGMIFARAMGAVDEESCRPIISSDNFVVIISCEKMMAGAVHSLSLSFLSTLVGPKDNPSFRNFG